ncbi:MAG: pyridoxal-phosphate dependent enzyme, partial [Dehalococcoidia bacterium]
DAARFGTRQNEAGEWVAYKGGDAWGGAGTSVFDPVLCELAYRWWCPEGGSILDPFAGGSVRGIVAARLGFSYCGIELREEQVAANCEQAARILGDDWDLKVQWIHADSKDLGELLADSKPFDFLFTCPPYYDLERYSDDPRDLSNAPSYKEFLAQFNQIMDAAVGKLAPDRFACLVVSDIRDKDGCYRGLERHSQVAMEGAGAKTYNLAVLIQPVGSAAIRAGKIFGAGRKLPRNHQSVQVFAKGRPWEKLKDLLGPTEWDDLGEPAEPAEPSVPHGTFAPAPAPAACSVEEVTPLELVGGVILKRDDSCRVAGVSGGKVRSCWRLAQGAVGLVTAGSRSSPQGVIVASIAAELGIPCRVHMPAAPAQDPTPEMLGVQAAGGEVVPVPRGRNNVIIASARRDAAARGWTEIPFGMECREAVEETARQVRGMRESLELMQRIVVPVGSGMSLAGILTGLLEEFADAATGPPPILGVVVGASPIKRLDLWAPTSWREHVELVESGSDYHKPAGDCYWHGVRLDSGYEAKCLPFLRPEGGDLFWVVGIRASEDPAR